MATAVSEPIGVPELLIRSMQPEDVADVIRVERASYGFPWTEGIFHDCLRVSYVCRVVMLEPTLVGYGIMSLAADEAHLLNVCVASSYRCRGIGRRLLAHLLQIARQSGARQAFLEARPSNVSAIRLYQSLGFTQIGVRRGYYQAAEGREDAIVLRHHIE